MVTPAAAYACSRSAIRSFRAEQRGPVDELQRHRRGRVALLRWPGRGPAPRGRRRRSPSGWRAGCRSSAPGCPCRRRTARRTQRTSSAHAATSSPTTTGTRRAPRRSRPSPCPALARPAAIGASCSPACSGAKKIGQPAVGDLAGQLQVLRADRGQVDRDVLAERVEDQLAAPCPGRPAAAACSARRRSSTVSRAQRHPDDLDVLPGAAQRLVEPHAVPALGDLRAGHAQAEPEPAAGERVEGGRGHRGHRRGAGRDLHDRAADVDPLGLRGDPGQQRGASPSRTPRPPRPPRSRAGRPPGPARGVGRVVAGPSVPEIESEPHDVRVASAPGDRRQRPGVRAGPAQVRCCRAHAAATARPQRAGRSPGSASAR